MGLSFLVGSTGHFGQPRGKNTSANYTHPEDSVLLIPLEHCAVMVEMLVNALQNRGKEGPGGYSAVTFPVKLILFSIRCLLTHTTNQSRFVAECGVQLNTLLIKVIAEHSIGKSNVIDNEAAEYAIFSLYLQSNYGFKTIFLPAVYGNEGKISGSGSVAAKILQAYFDMKNITLPGRHAAEQLLFRLRYLQFKGSAAEVATTSTSDYLLSQDMLHLINQIELRKFAHGARPNEGIFDRPILRSRAPKKGSQSIPWGSAPVRTFPCGKLCIELSINSFSLSSHSSVRNNSSTCSTRTLLWVVSCSSHGCY
jgi:hypothetical protein